MATVSDHAVNRLRQFGPVFGVPLEVLQARLAGVQVAECSAVVATLPAGRFVRFGDHNGDTLVAVVRGGEVTTVTLRRIRQTPLLLPVVSAVGFGKRTR